MHLVKSSVKAVYQGKVRAKKPCTYLKVVSKPCTETKGVKAVHVQTRPSFFSIFSLLDWLSKSPEKNLKSQLIRQSQPDTPRRIKLSQLSTVANQLRCRLHMLLLFHTCTTVKSVQYFIWCEWKINLVTLNTLPERMVREYLLLSYKRWLKWVGQYL